ncbi:MAG: type I-MYXAN CRISPR-associated protein Cas5/Cmx5/DevS [Gemmatales bacterium]|nr:MAG: type I-MYXAN CRISPR-associated protein Cas5/Cmx5/DevS [Gemmatales bacterium]
MLGLYVSVPIACFRKGLAREYLETEPIPPPATCYGFLLSLVGETQRQRHIGVSVCPVLINRPEQSVVLRTVWRCKDRNYWVDPNGKCHVVPPTKKTRDAFKKWVRSQGWPEPEFVIGSGSGTNARPDFQQLLSPVELILWLDSASESNDAPTLEARVADALDRHRRASVHRFGGLSLGESTHLVDEVSLLSDRLRERFKERSGLAFLRADRGRLTLPVWVDHVGSAGTRYVIGDLIEVSSVLEPPPAPQMARIDPDAVQE